MKDGQLPPCCLSCDQRLNSIVYISVGQANCAKNETQVGAIRIFSKSIQDTWMLSCILCFAASLVLNQMSMQKYANSLTASASVKR